ncbi:hypothetical protein [Nocardioides ganghwensis]|jgi:hypothetical protein|uniref:Uncharacterized protein n=1 Tax=Nocardioides ganghwensis TaxID=252230 RepID=A0A4Q2SFX8_9ACTN|nr:hypothetical protein [Nocardioides ganghwensis]MBD3946794.1 hypothetical protein [Nocardioides ganghwensis]RYC02714.1 hypothetical protein EUA07_08190 [Nocardioides ganghwensis]
MSTTTVRRLGVVAGAAAAAIAVTATSASAHHCFVPMYSLSGPTSANWFVVSAAMGAEFEGYAAECEGAEEAGYAALREAGLPVGLKIFEKMTIGDPKHTGRTNPNGADGIGLEYFADGSPLPEQMVTTYIAGAEAYAC